MITQNGTTLAGTSVVPRLSVTVLNERAAQILPEFAKGAAERERTRELPHRQIRQLATAKLFTFRIPLRYGGAGSSVLEVMRFIIDLAAVDSNIAQALRPNFALIEGLLTSDCEVERQEWFPRFLAGDVFGNAGWEIGGPNGAIATRITRDGDHFKVTGSKFYSTGALFADWVSTVALNEEDQPVSFIVPSDRDGLRLIDDFDAMGQRLTASGTTNLDNVTVYPHEVRTRFIQRDRRSPVTRFLQLYLAAVEAGVAKNVLADAVSFAQDYARPITHSVAERSVDDPYVQHAVGEISARAWLIKFVIRNKT
jgi:alkylation response protein AidB-like acyl-CoA dehydrogenase